MEERREKLKVGCGDSSRAKAGGGWDLCERRDESMCCMFSLAGAARVQREAMGMRIAMGSLCVGGGLGWARGLCRKCMGNLGHFLL